MRIIKISLLTFIVFVVASLISYAYTIKIIEAENRPQTYLDDGHEVSRLYFSWYHMESKPVYNAVYKTMGQINIPLLKDTEILISKTLIQNKRTGRQVGGITFRDKNYIVICNDEGIRATLIHEIGHIIEFQKIDIKEYAKVVYNIDSVYATDWFDDLQEDFAEDFRMYVTKKLTGKNIDERSLDYKKTLRKYNTTVFEQFLESKKLDINIIPDSQIPKPTQIPMPTRIPMPTPTHRPNNMTKKASSQYELGIIVNGKRIELEVQPIIIEGRTLVPIRGIFEAIGADVKWDDSTKTIISTKGDITVLIPISGKEAKVNSKSVPLDVSPLLRNGMTFMPIRFIAESLGCKVNWSSRNNAVIIE